MILAQLVRGYPTLHRIIGLHVTSILERLTVNLTTVKFTSINNSQLPQKPIYNKRCDIT